jgi:hypothetical protein
VLSVDIFYGKVDQIPSSTLHRGLDTNPYEPSRKQFFDNGVRRANRYTVAPLRARMPRALKKGLNDTHFDAGAQSQATLDELKVPAELAVQVMNILASAKNDVSSPEFPLPLHGPLPGGAKVSSLV